jgi:hypothetical protein
MIRAPIRMLEQGDLSSAERSLLEAGRAATPIDYDLAEGAARFRTNIAALAAAGAAATAHGATSGAGGKALLIKLTAKLLLGIAAGTTLVGGGLVAGVLLARRAGPATPTPTAVVELAPARSVLAPSAPAPELGAPAAATPDAPVPRAPGGSNSAEHTTISPSAPVAPAMRAGNPGQSARSAALISPSTATVGAHDGASLRPPSEGGSTGRASNARPALTEAVRAQAAAAPSVAPSAASTLPPEPPQAHEAESQRPAEASDSLSELRAIAVARSLLDTDPQAALGVLEKLRHDHPRGYFVEERRALIVLALAGAGQEAAARQQAAAFLRVFPNGPFSDRVRAVLRASN